MTPRSDTSWIAEFARRYETWLPEARSLLEAHRYAEAFKTYPYPSFADDSTVPWAPLRPAPWRLGVVTTAGVYRAGVDAPFDDTIEGDGRVLTLPADVAEDALDVAHSHIPQELARADINVVLPLTPIRALVAAGRLAGVAPRMHSLVGYRTRAHDVATETAPAIAARLAEDHVTLALVVPV